MSQIPWRERRGRRRVCSGFTLTEILIAVAIVGVLAALAIYGVQRYLRSSKSAEAKRTVGTIADAAVSAYERETIDVSSITYAQPTSAGGVHQLCGSAASFVPGTIAEVRGGKKYQPRTSPGQDFDSGSSTAGWKCLRFSMTQPITYMYGYAHNDTRGFPVPAMAGEYFVAMAQGDLDGDDLVFARFALGGKVANGQVQMNTRIGIENETE